MGLCLSGFFGTAALLFLMYALRVTEVSVVSPIVATQGSSGTAGNRHSAPRFGDTPYIHCDGGPSDSGRNRPSADVSVLLENRDGRRASAHHVAYMRFLRKVLVSSGSTPRPSQTRFTKFRHAVSRTTSKI